MLLGFDGRANCGMMYIRLQFKYKCNYNYVKKQGINNNERLLWHPSQLDQILRQ